MILTAHQPAYLPWAGLLDKIRRADLFVVLDNVPHSHGSFENRNRIRTAQGEQGASVPILSNGNGPLCEVKIAPGSWQRKHRRAIEMNYARAPHFELLDRLWAMDDSPLLLDRTMGSLRNMLEVLGIKTPIRFASEIQPDGAGQEMLIDLCLRVGADTFLFGAQGRRYADREAWQNVGIRAQVQTFSVPEYRQCYGGFILNLSALDTLLCCGSGGTMDLMRRGGKVEDL